MFSLLDVQRIVEAICSAHDDESCALSEAGIDVLDAIRSGDVPAIKRAMCDWEIVVECISALEDRELELASNEPEARSVDWEIYPYDFEFGTRSSKSQN